MLRGKVLEHNTEFFLKDVEFKVSQAGRNRVLKEQRKNVHAFVCGTPDDGWPIVKMKERLPTILISLIVLFMQIT